MSVSAIARPLAQLHLDRWTRDLDGTIGRRHSLADLTRIGMLELSEQLSYTSVKGELKLSSRIALIAISPDGLGMIEPALSMFPEARVWFIGEAPQTPGYMTVLIPEDHSTSPSDPLVVILLAPEIREPAALSAIFARMPPTAALKYLVFGFRVSPAVVQFASELQNCHLGYLASE